MKSGVVEKKRPGRPKKSIAAAPAAAPGGADTMPEKKSAAAEAPKSLLALVQREPAAPVPPPGFYLDFTGHEDLLERVLAASEDVNGDVLVMLQALLDGKLYSRDDVFGVMCDVQ